MIAAAVALSVACGSTSVDPETDLSGTWDFSFETTAVAACPNLGTVGCNGSGTLVLAQDHIELTGTAPLTGSCRTCGSIADFFGAPQPVVGSLIDSHLEFAIGGRCTFTGQAVHGPREYSGEAACHFEGATSTGEWRMTRR
jgi:hypothetical protein